MNTGNTSPTTSRTTSPVEPYRSRDARTEEPGENAGREGAGHVPAGHGTGRAAGGEALPERSRPGVTGSPREAEPLQYDDGSTRCRPDNGPPNSGSYRALCDAGELLSDTVA
jgi:hypothetical protein